MEHLTGMLCIYGSAWCDDTLGFQKSLIDKLEHRGELMREQTSIKWQQKIKDIQIQILVSLLWGQIKKVLTIFHIQITSPKYCTQKSGTISNICLNGSGPKFSPIKQIKLKPFFGVFESFN